MLGRKKKKSMRILLGAGGSHRPKQLKGEGGEGGKDKQKIRKVSLLLGGGEGGGKNV